MTTNPSEAIPVAREAAAETLVDVLDDGRCVPAISDGALWALASKLHSNVPEADRPMSWSDYSPEQIERLRLAAKSFLTLYATPPAPDRADEDEMYEIGVRDGYESAVQEIDLATGGDGEFKGSTIPGGTVDVSTMKARIIRRVHEAEAYADLRASGGIFPEAYAPDRAAVVEECAKVVEAGLTQGASSLPSTDGGGK